MSVKRALIAAPLMPEHDRESGSRRVWHLIEFLREAGWAVSFVAENPTGGERYAKELQQLGVATYAGFDTRTEELIASGGFDIVIFAFWYVAERLIPVVRRVSPETRVVVDSIDLHFLRRARKSFVGQAENGTPGLLGVDYASKMAREVNTYASADGVLAVSQKEADLIDDLVGDPTLAYLVSDAEELAPSDVSFAERGGVLCIANFRHPPNVEGVEYLLRAIVPRLDRALRAAHPVYIVGNALNERVRSYGRGLADVRMVGWVPSVLPYLERSRVSVVPLLHGAGTKRKLVQALMVGTPSVSTRIGIEGLELRHGEHVLVADNSGEFADSIARLLEDQGLWEHLAHRGRTHVMPLHGREAVQARLLEALSAILAKKAKHPVLVQPDLELLGHHPNVGYRQMIDRIRELMHSAVPPDATVIVVSRGDDELLQLDGRPAWHFPQTADGVYAGSYPADSAAAIAHLEELRARGGHFLLFPRTAFWWLEHYAGFKQHLEQRYRALVQQEESCLIFALREPAAERPQQAGPVREGESDPTSVTWETAAAAILNYAAQEGHTDEVARLLTQVLPRYVKPGVYRKYFPVWEAHGVHVTPVHFYYPIPDTRTLTDDLWTKESELVGIDMNESTQLRLLREHFPRFRDEYDEFPTAPTDRPYEFHFNNPLFGGTDALVLYCMVRHFRPKRILEVGSGFSSRVSAQAALRNGDTRLICIEPYPDPILTKGFPGLMTLIPSPVQQVTFDTFQQLGAGDILFIDSSHVARIGGDVNYLFLEVIPRLNPGVIVHVHDIFFPNEYRREWVMEELRFWSEQYVLQAFLAFNADFEVLMCNSYLGHKYPEELQATFPNSPWWGGGSFWMRRKVE